MALFRPMDEAGTSDGGRLEPRHYLARPQRFLEGGEGGSGIIRKLGLSMAEHTDFGVSWTRFEVRIAGEHHRERPARQPERRM